MQEKNSVQIENAAKSRGDYAKNLDDYIESKGKFAREVDNPVFGLIEKLGNVDENEKRRKWERASALMGLNAVFSAASGSAAALAGTKHLLPSNEPINYALNQIDRADRESRQDYNRYYKSALLEAVRGERRRDSIDDNYLKGLSNLLRDDRRDVIYSSKIATDFERQNAKDRAAMERLEFSADGKQKRRSTSGVLSSEKPEMYVKNEVGRRVPLYGDDITKLYQLGQKYEIDTPYRSAGSESVRRREFDVLMQRSYLLYERDKKAFDKTLNDDIKSSQPFTLKIK